MIVAPAGIAEPVPRRPPLMPLVTPPQPQAAPPQPYAAPAPPGNARAAVRGTGATAGRADAVAGLEPASPELGPDQRASGEFAADQLAADQLRILRRSARPPGVYAYPPGPHPPHFAPPPRPAQQPGWNDPGPDRPRFGERREQHPYADGSAADRPRSRGLIVAVSILAAVALVAVVAAIVLVIGKLGDEPADPAPTPSAAPLGAAPTNVQLRDNGASITITWDDPSGGLVPFIVAGGPNQLGRVAEVPAGQTSRTLQGLSPSQNYCFQVLAVYAVDNVASSGPVCTSRGAQPTPS